MTITTLDVNGGPCPAAVRERAVGPVMIRCYIMQGNHAFHPRIRRQHQFANIDGQRRRQDRTVACLGKVNSLEYNSRTLKMRRNFSREHLDLVLLVAP